MDIPVKKVCEFFNCFDEEVTHVELNKNTLLALKLLGIGSDVVNFWTCIKIIPYFFFAGFIQYGSIGHLTMAIKSDEPLNFYNIADDIAAILTTTSVTAILSLVSRHYPLAKEVCRQLGDFTNPDIRRPPGVVALAKLSDKNVIFSGCLITVVFSGAGILFSLEECEPGVHSDCGFIFEPYLPFIDVFETPWKSIYLVLTVISGILLAFGIWTGVTQYMVVAETIILNVEHLKNIIKLIPLAATRRERQKLIGQSVRYHCFLITMNKHLNTATQTGYAFHLCVTPINASVIVFQIMGKKFMVISAVQLVMYFMIIVLTCGSAERLKTESEKIYEVLIDSVPYDGDLQTMKDMQMMIIQSLYPLQMSAGGVTIVGHVLMGDIFKTIGSVLSIWNEMAE